MFNLYGLANKEVLGVDSFCEIKVLKAEIFSFIDCFVVLFLGFIIELFLIEKYLILGGVEIFDFIE